jgi:predicted DNA-binding transcriptional regulator YafY
MESVFKHAQNSLSSNVAVDWNKKIRVISDGLPVVRKSVTQDIIDTALECIFCESQVEIVYQKDMNLAPKKYRVSPLGIIVKGAKQYLVCIDERSNTETPKHFLFNHILECENAQMDIDRKRLIGAQSFDLAEYCKNVNLESMSKSDPITLIAEVKSAAWENLLENPLSENQKLDTKTDGDTQNRILSATVVNNYDLKRWILSHSHNITVIEPLSLRNEIQDSLASAASLYRDTKSEHKKVG